MLDTRGKRSREVWDLSGHGHGQASVSSPASSVGPSQSVPSRSSSSGSFQIHKAMQALEQWVRVVMNKTYVNEGDTVIDLMCGRCPDARQFIDIGIEKYYGFDANEVDITSAKARWESQIKAWDEARAFTFKNIDKDPTDFHLYNVDPMKSSLLQSLCSLPRTPTPSSSTLSYSSSSAESSSPPTTSLPSISRLIPIRGDVITCHGRFSSSFTTPDSLARLLNNVSTHLHTDGLFFGSMIDSSRLFSLIHQHMPPLPITSHPLRTASTTSSTSTPSLPPTQPNQPVAKLTYKGVRIIVIPSLYQETSKDIIIPISHERITDSVTNLSPSTTIPSPPFSSTVTVTDTSTTTPPSSSSSSSPTSSSSSSSSPSPSPSPSASPSLPSVLSYAGIPSSLQSSNASPYVSRFGTKVYLQIDSGDGANVQYSHYLCPYDTLIAVARTYNLELVSSIPYGDLFHSLAYDYMDAIGPLPFVDSDGHLVSPMNDLSLLFTSFVFRRL